MAKTRQETGKSTTSVFVKDVPLARRLLAGYGQMTLIWLILVGIAFVWAQVLSRWTLELQEDWIDRQVVDTWRRLTEDVRGLDVADLSERVADADLLLRGIFEQWSAKPRPAALWLAWPDGRPFAVTADAEVAASGGLPTVEARGGAVQRVVLEAPFFGTRGFGVTLAGAFAEPSARGDAGLDAFREEVRARLTERGELDGPDPRSPVRVVLSPASALAEIVTWADRAAAQIRDLVTRYQRSPNRYGGGAVQAVQVVGSRGDVILTDSTEIAPRRGAEAARSTVIPDLRERVDPAGPPVITPVKAEKREVLVLDLPTLSNTRLIRGRIRVRVDKSAIEAVPDAGVRRTFVGILGTLLFLSLALAFTLIARKRARRLASLISRPLVELSETVKSFSPDRSMEDSTTAAVRLQSIGITGHAYTREEASLAQAYLNLVERVTTSLRAQNRLLKTEEESRQGLERALKQLEAAQHRLLDSEKRGLLGSVAASVAHEIKNALVPAQEEALILTEKAKKLGHPEISEHATFIIDQVVRCMNLSRQLLGYAQPSTGSKTKVDLVNVVDVTIQLTRNRLAKSQISFDWKPKPVKPVSGIPSELETMLINLVYNGRDAIVTRRQTDPATPGVIGLRVADRDGKVVVEVSDNGCGMTEEVQAQVFRPFFTTKKGGAAPEGEMGFGLGLANVERIVQDHGGVIRFTSSPGKGTTFTIEFPAERGD